jgi:hypothetical protein
MALESQDAGTTEPFQLVTFRGAGPLKGIDLDQTNALLVAEDHATYGGHAP